jgi:preprotein translocase subunit SecY
MALAEGTPSAPGSASYPIPVTYTGKREDHNRQPVLPVKIWPAGPIILQSAE